MERNMKISINSFFDKMLEFFPSKRDDYEHKRRENYEGVDTIIIEDIFMPDIINILKK